MDGFYRKPRIDKDVHMVGRVGRFRLESDEPPDETKPLVAAIDLIDRAVGERDDVEVAVRAGVDVGADAEVAAEEQALALRDLPLADVVRDAILEPRIVHGNLAAVARQLQPEQMSALEERPGARDEEIAFDFPSLFGNDAADVAIERTIPENRSGRLSNA